MVQSATLTRPETSDAAPTSTLSFQPSTTSLGKLRDRHGLPKTMIEGTLTERTKINVAMGTDGTLVVSYGNNTSLLIPQGGQGDCSHRLPGNSGLRFAAHRTTRGVTTVWIAQPLSGGGGMASKARVLKLEFDPAGQNTHKGHVNMQAADLRTKFGIE